MVFYKLLLLFDVNSKNNNNYYDYHNFYEKFYKLWKRIILLKHFLIFLYIIKIAKLKKKCKNTFLKYDNDIPFHLINMPNYDYAQKNLFAMRLLVYKRILI